MLTTLMRSTRGRAIVAVVATVAAMAFAVPASAGLLNDTEEGLDRLLSHVTGGCESAVEVPATLLSDPIDISTCDLRGTLVHAGSLALRIPRTGGTGAATASLVTEDAPASTVTGLSVINTGREIVARVMRLGEATMTRGAPDKSRTRTAAADACSVQAHAYTGTYNERMRWRLNRDTIPSYLRGDLTAAAVADGARRVARGANDCGLRELTGVQQENLGSTARRADCGGPDGQSIVDFGERPEGTLATACWWYSVDGDVREIFEADVRFRDHPGTFYNVEPLGCTGRYALSGVATHEFGHVFGLAHVSESRFPHQTMSPSAPECSYDQSTLGRGDWLGLRNLYG